jgi:hypothetical protein
VGDPQRAIQIAAEGSRGLQRARLSDNDRDRANWVYFRNLSGGTSSWYDFSIDGVYDGLTDDKDLMLIQQNLGTNCLKRK